MTALKNNIGIAVLASAIVFLALVLMLKSAAPALGSTGRGSEYQATTTTSVAGIFAPETVLQTGNGTLGSVVITGATTGTINIYDATTSNSALRGNTASTSLLLASFPASAVVGTYTFDRVFFNGLYVSIVGTEPTTTITFR